MHSKEVQTTCPYCGVGCGVIAAGNKDGVIEVRGDKNHPANFGRLCSKGAALGQTLGLEERLLHPQIRTERVSWDNAIDAVAQGFSRIIQQYGPDSVAFYVSGQLLTEDYYVANKLMKGFIGSGNIDTNSRLCMSSSVAGHKRAFGADTVPCSYEDLEQARLVVLTGSNTAWCHPVLYQRISKAKRNDPDFKVVVIDPRKTATCEIADLHLPIQSGTDAILFNGLLAYLHEQGYANSLFVNNCTDGMEQALSCAKQSAGTIAQAAQQCGLSVEDVDAFYRLFAQSERVVTVYSQGVNQSSAGTDKVNSIINCHLLTGRIGRPGMGPFSFTGQPNAMGGREVGGLSNQLAAHMEIDNPKHRDRVQRFWRSPVIADQSGPKAVDLFRAVADGRIKAIWIMGTNPVVSMPDAERVRQALVECELVVVSDCMRNTDTTAVADILLPAATWGEKSGTVTNSERRISRQRAFLEPPGEARPDWWILCQVARNMGFIEEFAYESPMEIFREHAELSGFENSGERDFNISGLSRLTDEDYDDLVPIQWPVTDDCKTGTPRMFTDARFYTPDGKAQFVAVQPRPPVHAPDPTYPFILNTGRVRDQWHTMTRTGKAPRLTEHSPEPYAEIHPEDAIKIGTKEGALVRLCSQWGEMIARARINEGQHKGMVFVPMHWNSQYASSSRVDALVNPVVDPISGQPESKHTPVRIEPYQAVWHGFLLSRRELAVQDASYWIKAAGEGFFRYELAGQQSPKDWPAWARSMLCTSDQDVNWIEYADVAQRRYRGVRIVGNRVESCIFIAPDHELPPRNWLASLFGKQSVSPEERSSLLAGKPVDGTQDAGQVICACFGVGINKIVQAIQEQSLVSVEQIGEVLRAGTNCGSCIPELRRLLAEHAKTYQKTG